MEPEIRPIYVCGDEAHEVDTHFPLTDHGLRTGRTRRSRASRPTPQRRQSILEDGTCFYNIHNRLIVRHSLSFNELSLDSAARRRVDNERHKQQTHKRA